MVEKINKFQQISVDTIITLWRPDVETIFKDIQRNAATNWAMKDVEGNTDLFIGSGKLENWSTAKELDSFFILKTTDTIDNINDYNGEVSNNTFSSELVHRTP